MKYFIIDNKGKKQGQTFAIDSAIVLCDYLKNSKVVRKNKIDNLMEVVYEN